MKEGAQRLLKGVDSVPVGSSSSESHPPNPNPSTIEASVWLQAEQAAARIIRRIHPTLASEQRRNRVVEYLHKLIGIDIFPFGSFPLRTYLPNGDIDLTAIGFPSSEVALSYEVLAVLEREEHNKDSEFELKNVRYINAEVKLVKCLVRNIAIDVSFNQIGGLSTLCFFEQVDRFIGKDHLFKRSILLIKAWCYYESHILDSAHGLLSTYALETLILYIFHLFNSSLDGPLAVLYRFLHYYSKFDWDKCCISLYGPLSLSSLTLLPVESFDNDGGDLLLTEEFLRSCVDSFCVPVRDSEGNPRPFSRKHLNIVDPLRENNNLGRSVSIVGFFRIRSALADGARKLGLLLLLPSCSIRNEVNMLFMRTLDENGGGERPDLSPSGALGGSVVVELVPPVEKLEKENPYELSSGSPTSKGYRDLNKEFENVGISDLDEREGMVAPQKTLSSKQQNSTTSDPKDLVTSRTSVLRSLTESTHTASSIHEPFSLLDEVLDLSGDFDKHLDNLNYVVWYQEKMTNTPSVPVYESPPYVYYNHGVWTHGSQFTVPLSPRPLFSPASYYIMNFPVISSPYNIDDARRQRGTGTFFPNVDHHQYRERLFGVHLERLDTPQLSLPHASSASPNASGAESSTLKFGSFAPVSVEIPAEEPSRKSDSPISPSRGSGFTSPASSSSRIPALSPDSESASESYQLKDDDFPPLSRRESRKAKRG